MHFLRLKRFGRGGEMEEKLLEFLRSQPNEMLQIEKMPGDASTRRYFRAKNASGKSAIVMAAESFADVGEAWPFLQIQQHLFDVGVDVPKVLARDPENGFLLLEDLGDSTLLSALEKVEDSSTEFKLYDQVLASLLDLHEKAGPASSRDILPAFALRFDHDKLMWEVKFALEHFYEGYLGRKWRPGDREQIEAQFSELCRALDREPTVFTHRDFHSRNVMVVSDLSQQKDRMVMIDFQDARMGPCQYDLASLLRDSYYQLSETQVDKLLSLYYFSAKQRGLLVGSVAHFRRIFDWMAIQRNFKAIGSFASFYQRRGNPGYLKYIGNTFETMRRTLLGYPELKELRELLFHYYYF
jgi:N-acetylmuramate 1-kinase